MRAMSRGRGEVEALRKESAQLSVQLKLARQLRDEARKDAGLLAQAASVSAAKRADTDDAGAENSVEPLTVAAWSARLRRLRQLVAEQPDQQIPELKLLEEKDWLQIAQSASLASDPQQRAALGELRSLAKLKFIGPLHDALEKFTAASGGALPSDIGQLAPYFNPPVDPAMLQRYQMATTEKAGRSDGPIITEKPSIDHEGDESVSITRSGAIIVETVSSVEITLGEGGSAAELPPFVAELRAAGAKFVQANGGKPFTEIEQLRPYLSDPAKFDELMRAAKEFAPKP